MTPSVTGIFREIVARVAGRRGGCVSYLFGDWAYVCDVLTSWGSSPELIAAKYPAVCLLSPFTEDRTGAESELSLDFVIMTATVKDYTNEEREAVSFDGVLRPVYRLFLEETRKHPAFRYRKLLPHAYTENYRYGRLGVVGADGKPFGDFVDAIELKSLKLTIKDISCNGNYY